VSEKENESAKPQQIKPAKPLIPRDSDFERDPRDDESSQDRERDYLRDKPPHHG
jgi:hypothetical protein